MIEQTEEGTMFSRNVKAHLARYKTDALDVTADGLWKGNNRPYPHILPRSEERVNILEPFRDDFWKYFDCEGCDEFTLHKDFHHLNSSQALCFNLFYPFIHAGRRHLPLLLDQLDLSRDGVCEAAFEKVICSEEGTNFDFYVRYDDGKHAMFEVKYTENDFGTAKDDIRHSQKYEYIYAPMLRGVVQDTKLADRSFFLKNYQIMRNLAYLGKNRANTATFIIPSGNTNLTNRLTTAEAFVNPDRLSQFRVVSLEDLVEKLIIASVGVDSRLACHLEFLQLKYLQLNP